MFGVWWAFVESVLLEIIHRWCSEIGHRSPEGARRELFSTNDCRSRQIVGFI